jgi:poly(glycerol-phosphate) alpha-glucosyltransferase
LSAKADLVYCAGLWKYPSFLSLQWARGTRKPLVVAPHGMLDSWALNQSRGRKRLARLLYQNAQLEIAGCIRALCEAEARGIRKLGLKNPICIIPNGIDLPQSETQGAGREAESAKRQAPGAERIAQRKVLLYLGRIHPKKGLVDLLRAWRLALANSPSTAQEWVLAIAGWDQSRHEAELKQLATELGLQWSEPGAWCPPFRVSGASSTPAEGRGAKDAGGAQSGKPPTCP